MQTVIDTNIAAAANLLNTGEVVAIPTETVYGLAGNAYNPKAVAKIFEAKNRPYFDPLIVHTFDLSEVYQMVTHIPEPLLKLAKKYWPGPLTLLLEKKDIIPDLVTSGLPTVGIRIPNQPQTLELLSKLKFPLAAPSANPFGYVSPTSAEHVFNQLHGKIPYILDGGKCNVGLESTIVGMYDEKVTIFRMGGLSLEEIEATVGKVNSHMTGGDNPAAPGMLSSHYAPHKSIIVGDIAENLNKYDTYKIGIISFKKTYIIPDSKYCCILSVTGNMNEAAQHLFSAMRYLDNSEVDLILAEVFPNEGLGRAINDRLQRAAYKRNEH
ncbi:MAG: L-threonylcarbamoyladenylate synthase [Bacteroidota bacterium]